MGINTYVHPGTAIHFAWEIISEPFGVKGIEFEKSASTCVFRLTEKKLLKVNIIFSCFIHKPVLVLISIHECECLMICHIINYGWYEAN